MRERIASLAKNLTAQDTKAQELSNQLVEARMAVEASSVEIRQLRAEKEVLKAAETRAITENQGLVQQRNMCNEHLKSLQRMLDDVDRQSKENSVKAEEKTARLDKEMFVVFALYSINNIFYHDKN